MIYFIIAWRILHVVTLGQECQNLPLLGDMVQMIARFGGFLDRKSDGAPGSKAIWEGMEKVRHYAVGIEVGKAVYAT